MKFKGLLLGCFSLFLTLPLMASAQSDNESVNDQSDFLATAPAEQSSAASETANQGNLTVRVTGIRNDKGVIQIALFNSAEAFRDKTAGAPKAMQRAELPINQGEAVWELKNLPYGEYAIKLFHDEDHSGRIKKSFIGRPTEGVGFSNNPPLDGHAPKYDDAKFSLNQSQTDINIQMINPK